MTFLEAADRIGARLCRDAFWSGQRCNWIAEARVAEGRLEWSALGPDLYSGTAGIALFLHYLAEATGERLFRDTAAAAIAQAASQACRIEPGYRAGFYMGWGGIAFAAAQLGRVEEAAELASGIGITGESDVTYGSGGAIAALLHLGLIDAAIQHGDALLASAERGGGLSWRTLTGSEPEPSRNLTGFSHGTAGIGWVLLELFVASGNARFHEAAEEAFRYERACYDPERKNWPDYRGDSVDYATAWCHGAPGIGFSRVRASQLLPSGGYREEADNALATTEASLAGLGGSDYSLCHGLCGNADLLVYGSQVLNVDSIAPAAAAMRTGIDEYEANRKPWPCGLRGGGEIPGLMLGIAGIGYFCLRLTDPVRYPTVLLPTVWGAPARIGS